MTNGSLDVNDNVSVYVTLHKVVLFSASLSHEEVSLLFLHKVKWVAFILQNISRNKHK